MAKRIGQHEKDLLSRYSSFSSENKVQEKPPPNTLLSAYNKIKKLGGETTQDREKRLQEWFKETAKSMEQDPKWSDDIDKIYELMLRQKKCYNTYLIDEYSEDHSKGNSSKVQYQKCDLDMNSVAELIKINPEKYKHIVNNTNSRLHGCIIYLAVEPCRISNRIIGHQGYSIMLDIPSKSNADTQIVSRL
jgi:hypothetical protein